jgi:hypothetical protein
MGLADPGGVMYLNTESNKKLPFPAKFIKGPDGQAGFNVTDPMQVPDAFNHAETLPGCHSIVVDSLTFLMDQYESLYVLNAANTMKAWGDFAQYYKTLMQQYVANSTKNVYFLAHTMNILNESDSIMETKVPVKGSLKNNGIEAYFSVVVGTKRMALDKLEPYESAFLNFTEEEKILGFKHVFQTKLTKQTINERIRAPMGMWSMKETFIDNNVQHLTTRLHEYYG